MFQHRYVWKGKKEPIFSKQNEQSIEDIQIENDIIYVLSQTELKGPVGKIQRPESVGLENVPGQVISQLIAGNIFRYKKFVKGQKIKIDDHSQKQQEAGENR